jgi:HEAT repeat protein
MSRLNPRCRCLALLGMALFFLPAASRAADPVEQLREALRIDPLAEIDPNPKLAAKRNKLIESILPELKSVAQLRRAYFLKQWPQNLREDKPAKIFDVDRYRIEIGDKLTEAIKDAAADTEPDIQIAVAMLIAEIGDAESFDSRGKEKFTRGLTEPAKALARSKTVAVRQSGLHALGKIAPDPAEALPILKETLQKDEVGPRRLAAFALSDLIKTARSLGGQQKLLNAQEVAAVRKKKLQTLDEVIAVSVMALRDADEPVRGYSLQAIQASAKLLTDQFASIEELTEEVKGKRTMRPNLQNTMRAYQAANPPLLQAIYDSKLNVRLAAVRALDQIGTARTKIATVLQEQEPDQRMRRAELLKSYDVPDPLAGIVSNLGKVADLLQENDVSLRRGAIDFLELLGDQAEPAVNDVTQALRDPDRNVRWSAARTLRHVPSDKVGAEAVRRLATMLVEPDPDLSAAAAATLEALGPAAHDAVDWLAFVTAGGDGDSRNWDTENRVAAMKGLAGIGGSAAQRAIPQLASALGDDDVRVRREAAYTLGRIGRPTDASLAQRAVAALRRALSDEDAEVRLYASESILSIMPARKKL